jgi:peptidoglycan/xylan/chitin deacetylase (PgdA/CDA1 family)
MKRREVLLAVAASALLPRASAAAPGVAVLMYHAVNDTVPRNPISLGLTLPIASFESQLRYLTEHRLPTLTAGQLVTALARGEHPRGVVLTFDDGYADAARFVVPLLVKYRARATFFINSGSIGSPNHCTWADLRAMQQAGMELGAHGVRHLDLTTLDRAGQMEEAGKCVDKIEKYAGTRPVSYAYASGQYNPTTLEVMHAIGIRSAWTERVGTVHDIRDPYRLPRLRVARGDGIDAFASLVGK